MNRILGYSVMGIGLLGFLFFLKYKGTAIPVKELWFILSFFALIVGVYFIVKHKMDGANFQRIDNDGNRMAEIEHLKLIGEKVRVTLDNAEVKCSYIQQEIVKEGLASRMEMLDGLYNTNRNNKTQEIQQTYIVFYKKYNNNLFKFISQTTTQSPESVKRYIDGNKGIDLYIDKENPTNYYFDLPFL